MKLKLLFEDDGRLQKLKKEAISNPSILLALAAEYNRAGRYYEATNCINGYIVHYGKDPAAIKFWKSIITPRETELVNDLNKKIDSINALDDSTTGGNENYYISQDAYQEYRRLRISIQDNFGYSHFYGGDLGPRNGRTYREAGTDPLSFIKSDVNLLLFDKATTKFQNERIILYRYINDDECKVDISQEKNLLPELRYNYCTKYLTIFVDYLEDKSYYSSTLEAIYLIS